MTDRTLVDQACPKNGLRRQQLRIGQPRRPDIQGQHGCVVVGPARGSMQAVRKIRVALPVGVQRAFDGGLGLEFQLPGFERSEEHTSELQSLMRISYAVFCLKKKKIKINTN